MFNYNFHAFVDDVIETISPPEGDALSPENATSPCQ